jgi:hypothetical protein
MKVLTIRREGTVRAGKVAVTSKIANGFSGQAA